MVEQERNDVGRLQRYAGSCGRIGPVASARCAKPTGDRCLKTLAQPGTIYHGSLYLAVQYASVIFKQLFDFRTGGRTNGVMPLLASNGSGNHRHRDRLRLSAKAAAHHRSPRVPKPGIVICGAQLRGIAPRSSCHGGSDNWHPTVGGSVRSLYEGSSLWPWRRPIRNEITRQMRSIARVDSAGDRGSGGPLRIIAAATAHDRRRFCRGTVRHFTDSLSYQLVRSIPKAPRFNGTIRRDALSLGLLRVACSPHRSPRAVA